MGTGKGTEGKRQKEKEKAKKHAKERQANMGKGKRQYWGWGCGQPWQTYGQQQYQDPREFQQQRAPAATPAPAAAGQQIRKIQKPCRFFAGGNCKHVAAGTECPFLHGTT